MLPLDSETDMGRVAAVGILSGERYYWLIDKHGVVSMMPADAVEPRCDCDSHMDPANGQHYGDCPAKESA